MNMTKIVEKYGKELRKKDNVVLVGEGMKMKRGIYTGERAVVVGVVKKLPIIKLDDKDVIPTKLARTSLLPAKVWGVKTDVVETGEIWALGMDRKSRCRPAPGGVSIGHPDVTAGTLGRLVKKNGVTHILSNNHVLANSNAASIGDPIYQPGVADGGGPDDEICKLAAFVEICKDSEEPSRCPFSQGVTRLFNFFAETFGRKTRLVAMAECFNIVDCAIARVNDRDDVVEEILGFGCITGEAEPELGMPDKWSGRTSAVKEGGKVKEINVEVLVNFGKLGKILFKDQFTTDMPAIGGDSGSVVLTEDNKCIGLLFAGGWNTMIANRYSNVEAALGLD